MHKKMVLLRQLKGHEPVICAIVGFDYLNEDEEIDKQEQAKEYLTNVEVSLREQFPEFSKAQYYVQHCTTYRQIA